MRYNIGDILRYRYPSKILKTGVHPKSDEHYLIVGFQIHKYAWGGEVQESKFYNTIILETGEPDVWNYNLVDDNPKFTKVK